jgi:hypothetical protein
MLNGDHHPKYASKVDLKNLKPTKIIHILEITVT